MAVRSANLLKGLIPTDALPFARTTLTCAFHGVQNSFGVINLVEGRWTLRAVAAPTARMFGVTLDLLDLVGVVVEVGHEPAASLAVEAGRRNECVVPLYLVGPGLGIEFGPVVPLIKRRILIKIGHELPLMTAAQTARLGRRHPHRRTSQSEH